MKTNTLSAPKRIPLFLLAQTVTPQVKPWQSPSSARSAFPVEDFLAMLFQRRNAPTRNRLKL